MQQRNNSNGNSNGPNSSLPGYNRRKLLRDAGDGVPMVSNFFPIERYYDASDKVFESFEMVFEQRNNLDSAYVYGRRYCTFYVNGISKHDYYHSKQPEACRLRKRANQRVDEVLKKLELVSDWMDAEELDKETKRLALLERQKKERERKQRELEQQRIEELQKRVENLKRSSTTSNTSTSNNATTTSNSNRPVSETTQNIGESALAKLQRLKQPAQQLQPKGSKQQQQQQQQNNNYNYNNNRVNSNSNVNSQSHLPAEPDGHFLSQLNLDNDLNHLPPPLLPPTTQTRTNNTDSSPPSYNSIVKQSSYFGPSMDNNKGTKRIYPSAPPSYDHNHKNTALSTTANSNANTNQRRKERPSPLPERQRISQIVGKHRQYQQEGRIQVSPLRTYQGRVNGSTNGCTVISACVVSKHMETHGGVNDSQIQSVIDKECVPLLQSIRNKLNLGGASLIIPSDVHDYLVDHKMLYQHKFAGVAGGNISDPTHLGQLISLLKGEEGKTSHLKAGATLFFREHVISIVKFPTGATDAIYDMIDSMPSRSCNGRGSRTRCHSLDALHVHLEFYCTGKFSDTNIKYIEHNRWDDAMADFDPRVFQSFVWANLPKVKQ